MLKRTIYSALAGIGVGIVCWLLTHSLWCIVPAVAALVAVFYLMELVKSPVNGPDALSIQLGDDPEEILDALTSQTAKVKACIGVIPNEGVNEQLEKISLTLDNMIEYLASNKDDAHKLRKLVKYYLPTLLSMLMFCEEYGQTDEEWMGKFSQSLSKTRTALESMAKQLYQHQKIITEVEMDVMVKMMQRDGHLRSMDPLQ